MSIPILICDDSNLARKQVFRALPTSWDVDVTYAKNGVEGIDAIKAGQGEVVFLDLTMPELDGFGVLEQVRHQRLKSLIFVISADIQPEAKERVLKLGALEFIKKPINKDTLSDLLTRFGLI